MPEQPCPAQLPACACLSVEYRPHQHEDGSLSDCWVCRLCGAEFVRWDRAGTAEVERDRLRAKIRAQADYMRTAAATVADTQNSVSWLLDMASDLDNIVGEVSRA